MTLHIRTIHTTDRSFGLSLWCCAGLVDQESHVVAEADIDRKLSVQPELFLVGTLGAEIVATAMAGYHGQRGHLSYLAVTPPCQRQGIGRKKIAQVKSLLAEQGCHRLTLYVSCDNLQVVPFYQRLGFDRNDVLSMGIAINPRPADQYGRIREPFSWYPSKSAFSPNGKHLISGSMDRTVKISTIPKGTETPQWLSRRDGD